MSHSATKSDHRLGMKVHAHLCSLGLETPMAPFNMLTGDDEREHHRQAKIAAIQQSFSEIMTVLGLDLGDDSLIGTPKRVARMYVDEIFWGLDYSKFPKCTAVDNKMAYDEMVIERNINVQSNCEHHFVVIDGKATVAYIPKGRVIGLSKMNRIVEFFSKRPQIQERLTEQIQSTLCYILGTEDVAVVIDAQHYCVKSRGIQDVGSSTITSKLSGSFKSNPTVRAEFMSLVQK